ncbi:MAG TPA: hypothetical protein VL097_01130 [Rhodanobacter sp.]|nr:hypothetical protein [Rhodanobacter sp.]
MRTFDDAQGQHWQAALMEASFGGVVLVFGRIGGSEVLQQPLDAEVANLTQAEQLLADLDEAGLRRFLAAAVPWSNGG